VPHRPPYLRSHYRSTSKAALSILPRMGVRTRGLDIKAGAAKLKADLAARLEAELVVDRWNRRLATGRDMLWSLTIGPR
jgi:hypothetical protein